MRFTLGEISLEFGLELTRTRGADGGLRFSVLSLGGKRESSQGATHTLKVQLAPHRNDGGNVDVSLARVLSVLGMELDDLGRFEEGSRAAFEASHLRYRHQLRLSPDPSAGL